LFWENFDMAFANRAPANGTSQWLTESLGNFRIPDVDEETAASYATVRMELKKARTPIPSSDVRIAALCRQHSLFLLSRDRHFDLVVGICRIDW
jgi:predicted nucleic acid-binding protein